jgi:hypothetical protein
MKFDRSTPVFSQIGGLLASRGCNPLLCLHQGAPLPSSLSYLTLALLMPGQAAPEAGQ